MRWGVSSGLFWTNRGLSETSASLKFGGWGRGVPLAKLDSLERTVQDGLQPDLTLYFDLAPELARARIAHTRTLDRFEREQLAFFERVRAGYLV